jgi:hypothetical protein
MLQHSSEASGAESMRQAGRQLGRQQGGQQGGQQGRAVNRDEVPAPISTGVGMFHVTKADPTDLKTGVKGDVHVTFALTDPCPENGWFIFMEGSHRRTSPSTWEKMRTWKRVHLNMKAGDAVVWYGHLIYIHSSGGGGKFETLVYM